MADPRKILGEFVSYEEQEFYGVNKYVVRYKQPNSADPSKVWKHQAIEADLTDAAIDMLVGLSAGERMCVHQDKDDKGYPVITNISNAKDAPEKSAGGKAYQKGGNYAPRDDSGIAVGAAWTNAIEVLKLTGTELSAWGDVVDTIASIAEKVLTLKLAQEAKLKASKATKGGDKPAEAEKPKSRAELAKEKKAAEAKAEKPKAPPAAKKEPEPEDEVVEQDDDVADIEDDDLEDVNF